MSKWFFTWQRFAILHFVQVAAASPAELLASLPGIGDAEKLRAAAEAMLRLGQVADELQAHNLALKQDLGRAAQQQQQQQQQLQQRLSSGGWCAGKALSRKFCISCIWHRRSSPWLAH
eukprot:scaffold52910_cov14-Tisochrysis_lutea.AAC.2